MEFADASFAADDTVQYKLILNCAISSPLPMTLFRLKNIAKGINVSSSYICHYYHQCSIDSLKLFSMVAN